MGIGRWSAFFVLLFVIGQILASVIEGGGFAVTRLSMNVTADATVIVVDSTENFLSADATHPAYFQMGNEIVKYTGKTLTTFTGCTRGASDPQTGSSSAASGHVVGTSIKTLNIAALDSFMGYNITTSGAQFGTLDAVKFVGKMFVNLPKMLLWDYPWFSGTMVLFRFILFALSAGFLFGIGFAMLTLAQSIWG